MSNRMSRARDGWSSWGPGGLGFGLALGVVLGVALDNVGLGISLGLLLGLLLSGALRRRPRPGRRDSSRPPDPGH